MHQTVAAQVVEAVARFRTDMDRVHPARQDAASGPEALGAQEAARFAGRTGLGTTLCTLLREFAAYPGTRVETHWNGNEYRGLDLLSADRTSAQDRSECMELLRIRFSFKHKRYAFEFQKHWPLYIDGGPDYYQAGHIRVLEADDVVCVCSVAQNYTDDHGDDYAYVPLRFTALKLGDWTQAVVQLDEVGRMRTRTLTDRCADRVLYINAYNERAGQMACASGSVE